MRSWWAIGMVFLLFSLVMVGCGGLDTNGYNVSGTVTSADGGVGIPGTTIAFDGGGKVKTDDNGSWSKSGLSGTVSVVPSRSCCSFTPLGQYVNGPKNDVNFRISRFEDAFDDSHSGWPDGETGSGEYGYSSGKYGMEIKNDGNYSFACAPLIPGSVKYTVQVNAEVTSGGGYYGLIFNLVDWSLNHMLLELCTTSSHLKQWRLVSRVVMNRTATETEVIPWRSCDQIKDSGMNNLKIIQDGGKITAIYINNSANILKATDPASVDSFPETFRYSALFVKTGNTGEPSSLTAQFDDFCLDTTVTANSSSWRSLSLNRLEQVNEGYEQ